VQRLTKEYLALRGSPTATPTPSPTRWSGQRELIGAAGGVALVCRPG